MRFIPFTGEPAEDVTVVIDGRELTFSARYSDLADTWSLSIIEGGICLAAGIAIVIGTDLLGSYRLGLGRLYAVAVERPLEDASENEVGVRVQIMHFRESEVGALLSA